MKFKSKFLIKYFCFVILPITCVILQGCDQDFFNNENDRSFLSFSPNVNYSNLSANDISVVSSALSRFEVNVENGLYIVETMRGAEINISEELFVFVRKSFENANKRFVADINLALPRLKSAQEGTSQDTTASDCLAHAIAYTDVTDYNYAWLEINAEYGNGGVELEDFEDVCKMFFPDGSEGDASSLDSDNVNNSIIIIDSGTSYHAVNGILLSTCGEYVYYRDPQRGENVTKSISDIKTVFYY